MIYTDTQIESAQWLRRYKGLPIIASIKEISSSRMTRKMSFAVIENNTLINLNYHISRLLNLKMDKRNNLIISGCGIGTVFYIIYKINLNIAQIDGLQLSFDDEMHYIFDANKYLSI